MQLSNDQLTIELAARGAELRSIRTADGAEWLWQGDPAWWSGRSPLLFPVIGRSPGNHVAIAGKRYPMASHGVARVSDFALDASGPGWARHVLEATDETRKSYPFAFRLAVTHRLDGPGIEVSVAVSNLDNTAMPFQFGFHPAFNWPLPGSIGKEHRVILGNGGEPPLSRLDANGLLLPGTLPSPFRAGRLVPDRSQYEADAMLFVEGAGDAIAFLAQDGARLDMRTRNLPNFALWQKPGAPYLCLEPWHGTAPYAGSGDALETRNGAALLAPGDTMEFAMTLTLDPA